MQQICAVNTASQGPGVTTRRPLCEKGVFFCAFSSPELPKSLTKFGLTGPFAFGTLDSHPCILRCFAKSASGCRYDRRSDRGNRINFAGATKCRDLSGFASPSFPFFSVHPQQSLNSPIPPCPEDR